jgi:hypothetical protein
VFQRAKLAARWFGRLFPTKRRRNIPPQIVFWSYLLPFLLVAGILALRHSLGLDSEG